MPRTTTLMLDDDLAEKLETEAQHRGEPLEAVINATIRRGLGQNPEPTASQPYSVDAKAMGMRPGLSLECVEQLLDEVEGPLRR